MYISNETDKRLIALVRGYPILYDPTKPQYMDSQLKNTIWHKIGAHLNIDGASCRARWANMRDHYRRTLKKRKCIGKGRTSKFSKAYRYSDELAFLIPCLEDFEEATRMSKTEVEVTVRDSTGDEGSEDVPREDEEHTQDSSTDATGPAPLKLKIQSTFTSSEPAGDVPRKTPKLPVEQSSTANYVSPDTATGVEHVFHGHESVECASPSQHPVDAFLAGLAPVLKKLSPLKWHHAKGEMFDAVQKYELATIMNKQ